MYVDFFLRKVKFENLKYTNLCSDEKIRHRGFTVSMRLIGIKKYCEVKFGWVRQLGEKIVSKYRKN